jgi:hypothetical protein
LKHKRVVGLLSCPIEDISYPQSHCSTNVCRFE